MRMRILLEEQRCGRVARPSARPSSVRVPERAERVLARAAAVRILATLPREDDVGRSGRCDATTATEISTLEISEEF